MWQPLQQGSSGGGYGQQFDRAQQVNELLVAQPLCRAINPDRSLLEVGVRLQDGTLTSLRVSLPPGFPSDRPALSITSPVRHPWVDSIGRLSFPLLERWGAPSIRLASVVADAFKGLGGQPATAPSKSSTSSAAQQQQGAAAQQQAGAAPAGAAQQQQQHVPPGHQSSSGRLGSARPSGPPSLTPEGSSSTLAAAGSSGRESGGGIGGKPPMPAIPSAFPEVAALSEEQLEHLLVDRGAYQKLVQELAGKLHLWQAVDDLKGQSRELAAANLACAEEQAGIRNQLAVVRASDYAPAKASFDAKWARQQAVLSKLSPDVLMRRLQDATREAEEEGERLLSQLGVGELSLETFVDRYTRAQATYHQRDLKLQAAQQTLPPLHR